MKGSALGLIGLGLVGSALAERFLHAGFSVHGYDIDAARMQEFGGVAQSALDVARTC